MEQNKKVLITGGLGFIGHHLANALHNNGYDVTVIDKNHSYFRYLNNNIEIFFSDICNLNNTILDKHYDYVYNCAVNFSLDNNFTNDMIHDNIRSVSSLVINFPKSRIINLSSPYAINPTCMYGFSRKSGEQVLNLHNNSINIRLMTVFGEEIFNNRNNVIYKFIDDIENKNISTIYGGKSTYRDMIYIYDAIDNIIFIGEGKRKGVTELGYQKPISIVDLHLKISTILKKKSKYKIVPLRSGELWKSKSKYKLKEPKYGLNEGLIRTIRWYLKENGDTVL